jgi:hypothetical protein
MKKKKMKLVLTASDIWALRALRPKTHELGGTFDLNDEGIITNTLVSSGEACRDASGKLLPGKICSVKHPVGPVVWHTHPRANRPSSSDLRNSVTGKNTHIIATPLGIWAFRATPALVDKWRAMSQGERRRSKLEWRFMGHQHQKSTQNGEVDAFIAWARRAGFSIAHIAYADTAAEEKLWVLHL